MPDAASCLRKWADCIGHSNTCEKPTMASTATLAIATHRHVYAHSRTRENTTKTRTTTSPMIDCSPSDFRFRFLRKKVPSVWHGLTDASPRPPVSMLSATLNQPGLQRGWYFFTLGFGPPETIPPNIEAGGQGGATPTTGTKRWHFFCKNRTSCSWLWVW